MRRRWWIWCLIVGGVAWGEGRELAAGVAYRIVDTGQRCVFNDRGQLLTAPGAGEAFFGQDGYYQGAPADYRVSEDGLTVLDRNTGLTWQRSPDQDGDGAINWKDKLTFAQARARPGALNAARFGGFSDWRLPTIKELYSLIDFRGIDPHPMMQDTTGLKPFIDEKTFKFAYGDSNRGERIIDSQYASSTLYVSKGWRGEEKLFGVNFADGRIKGYGLMGPGGRGEMTFLVMCVRGNPKYGVNDFCDNGDGTISDRATGLMWAKNDSGKGMNWEQALAWVVQMNREKHLGHEDWRLPTAKELQSIVDYTRSPDTSQSAAIDPMFKCSGITNEARQADYPSYWTGTTHGSGAGRAAVYIAFGRAMGFMGGAWRDVHGAGAQRSDPKSGDPADYPQGRGPQGDAIRIYNYVRPVRNMEAGAIRVVKPDVTALPVVRMPPPPEGRGGERRLGR